MFTLQIICSQNHACIRRTISYLAGVISDTFRLLRHVIFQVMVAAYMLRYTISSKCELLIYHDDWSSMQDKMLKKVEKLNHDDWMGVSAEVFI